MGAISQTTLERMTEEYRELKANGYKGDVLTVALANIERLEFEHDEIMDAVIWAGSKKLIRKLAHRVFWYRERNNT